LVPSRGKKGNQSRPFRKRAGHVIEKKEKRHRRSTERECPIFSGKQAHTQRGGGGKKRSVAFYTGEKKKRKKKVDKTSTTNHFPIFSDKKGGRHAN